MKFSVLLPTRNRLDYLRYAIETVRQQEYDDWECIISDNDSEDDIAGYVQSLNDPRFIYVRTATFIPVTDNWNNALEQSSGNYVIMLGDDDGLMPGYLRTLAGLIQQYNNPDVIYTGAWLFAYPGVMPGYPEGYVQPYGYASFLQGLQEPRILSRQEAHRLVQHSMHFRVRFGYNMQFVAVSRTMIEEVRHKGAFFQSPYPDYYAMNVLFLKAARILAVPHRLVIIGVTPKSFGFYFFNKQERTGIAFLNTLLDTERFSHLEHIVLPGSAINTSWLYAMEAIRANYGDEFSLAVDYRRYRMLQIIYTYKNAYVDRRLTGSDLYILRQDMHAWERVFFGGLLPLPLVVLALVPPARGHRWIDVLRPLLRQFPRADAVQQEHGFANLLELFDNARDTHV